MIHKCVHPKCSYYRNNLKQVPKGTPREDRHKYKLHYIDREFSIDFIKMDMTSLLKNASSLQIRKNNAPIKGLYLTYSVNLGHSLRKAAQALKKFTPSISPTQRLKTIAEPPLLSCVLFS